MGGSYRNRVDGVDSILLAEDGVEAQWPALVFTIL
jgi:hypothetical protein